MAGVKRAHGNAKYRNSIEKLNIVTRILAKTSPTFKDGKIKKDMNIGAACAEEGITHQLFRMWLRADPALMALYEENRQAKVDLMRSFARGIVMDALSGGMKLKDKEKVDISLRFLEKTDDAWKDKHEIEVKVENFALTNEELEARAKELLTNIKNATNGGDEQGISGEAEEDESYSVSDDNEESE